MKKKIDLFSVVLALMLGIMSFTLSSCGDDEKVESDNGNVTEYDMVGYWYFENADEFEAVHLEYEGIAEKVFGIQGNPKTIVKKLAVWNTNEVDGIKVSDVKQNYLVLEDSGEKMVFRKINTTQWNNLVKTATLDGSGSGDDQPSDPDSGQDKYAPSDFVGIWDFNNYGYYVFETDGSAIYYWMTSIGSHKITGENTKGKWSFESSTSTLSTSGFKEIDNRSWIISDLSNSSFIGKYDNSTYTWKRVDSLPDIDSSDDNSLMKKLCYTWKTTTKYDGTFELEFRSTGLVKETWSDGSDKEFSNDEFSLSGTTLVFGGELIFTNTFGSEFKVSFSSNEKSMTLKSSYESITFTRVD